MAYITWWILHSKILAFTFSLGRWH